MGDPTRLQQVLTNLVGNAIKFTDEGEVRVSVRILKQDGARIHLGFAISDTGIGIPHDKREQIFESFTQADGSTTRRFGGTGLGLAIASRLVRGMGGAISVESEPGRGSTFRFELQLDIPPDAEDPPELRGSELLNAPVLIVTSHPAAKVLCGYANKLGMLPTAAESGVEAMRLLCAAEASNQPYSLLFTEYHTRGYRRDGIDPLL